MKDQSDSELPPRLADLVAGGDDLLDLVLRGHLHVEQLLLSMVEHWAVNPRYLVAARLSFSQKLSLVRALNLHHPDEPIWSALEALNSLRNDLAHRLTSDQREKKVAAFITLTNEDSPSADDSDKEVFADIHQQLLSCFAYLFGGLEAMGNEYSIRASAAKSIGKLTAFKRAAIKSEA